MDIPKDTLDLMATFHTEVNENEDNTTKTTKDAEETNTEKRGTKQASWDHIDYICSSSGKRANYPNSGSEIDSDTHHQQA
ncbi:hypothetical protein Hamer_G019350 [Homarus americanus]|uniref:Uncharacterized protein n=1 Tax=Homarus americanus TaxID=6706 RepID=A0A8J5MSK9_HOMAM|nr:hypothetical protein Hamer_G019350 [Homarus americanus]